MRLTQTIIHGLDVVGLEEENDVRTIARHPRCPALVDVWAVVDVLWEPEAAGGAEDLHEFAHFGVGGDGGDGWAMWCDDRNI